MALGSTSSFPTLLSPCFVFPFVLSLSVCFRGGPDYLVLPDNPPPQLTGAVGVGVSGGQARAAARVAHRLLQSCVQGGIPACILPTGLSRPGAPVGVFPLVLAVGQHLPSLLAGPLSRVHTPASLSSRLSLSITGGNLRFFAKIRFFRHRLAERATAGIWRRGCLLLLGEERAQSAEPLISAQPC